MREDDEDNLEKKIHNHVFVEVDRHVWGEAYDSRRSRYYLAIGRISMYNMQSLL